MSCDITTIEGNNCTYAAASFSKSFSNYALTCSGPDPTIVDIYESETDTKIRDWEHNTNLRTKIKNYDLPTEHFVRIAIPGTPYEAAVKLMLPKEIDFETPGDKKYPMIIDVYAGPNSARVSNSYSSGFKNYLITSQKIIYASIDGRGSANKGLDMVYELNNKLGTVEILDQITVTKILQERYKFIDAERTAIWGWSYGGYATALALEYDTENVFKCGISVAPVTNWMYYNTMYTERYMGTPQENAKGYADGDATQKLAQFENHKHKFLLIHGNADDNVHYQQTMALSRSLQKADILFEQISYPDENHGLGGVSKQLYNKMDEFWKSCLDLE